MSRTEQEVFDQAREVVRNALDGFVFEELTPEKRNELCETITAQWRKLSELVPPPQPEITITRDEGGDDTKVWVCIPVPYYIQATLRGAAVEIPEDDEPFYVIMEGEGPNMQFVEIETADGRGIGVGKWARREDGLMQLGPFYARSQRKG